jgi:FixJ family two-component response regulator
MPEQKQTIVVVDDDASMSKAIERLLHASGFQAVTFPSAEALLYAGAPAAAGCLVADVRLPGLSGFDLYWRLAESGRKLPVIFITAHDNPSVRQQADETSAVAYLPKPFSRRQLLNAVSRALGIAIDK